MKVLHVIPSVAPRYGGPSQAIIELCRGLQDEGIEAEICTTDADGSARLPVELGILVCYQGARCHFFRRDWSEAFKFSQSMRRWLDKNIARYDIVHIHAVFAHATYAAARACRRTGIPYIVRPLGTLEPWSMRQKPVRKQIGWRLLFHRVLRQAAAVHYTTEQERTLTEDSLGLHNGVVVPNGIDESLLEVQSTGQFRKSHDIPADAPVLLTLSRLHPKKGLDLLLKAFVDLKTQGRLAKGHLVIAGDGAPDYVSRLHEVARHTPAERFVHWTGWLEGESKIEAMAEADLFVLSSFQENFGIGAVEAMACGTPVLLSRQVGLSADVAKHNAGWIVDLHPDGLRSGLLEATNDATETQTRGENARRLVAERFTWRKVATQCRSLYESVPAGKVTVVIKPGNVGDHLCALPLYLALKNKFGSLVLVTQNGRRGNPGARALFRSGSPFEEIVELATPVWQNTNRSALDRIRSRYRPTRMLHVPVEDYSLSRTLGLHGFWSITFRQRVAGFAPVSAGRKRAHLMENGRLRSEVVRLLDWGTTNLGVTPVDITAAMAQWLDAIESRQLDSVPSPFAIIAAGTNDSVKQWPLDRYVKVAEWLQDDFHTTPVWVGSPADQAAIERAGLALPGVSLIGKTSLEETLLLISKAQLVVCNDSMAGHMAALTKTPCVSIFSARTLPGLWWPENINGSVIQKRLPCEGCELRHASDCPHAHACIDTITAEEVTEFIAAKLNRANTSQPVGQN